MAGHVKFDWGTYFAPTPKLATQIGQALLTGCMAAIPYVATLPLSDNTKVIIGTALGAFGIVCRVLVRFFDSVPAEPDPTVAPSTEEPNGPAL